MIRGWGGGWGWAQAGGGNSRVPPSVYATCFLMNPFPHERVWSGDETNSTVVSDLLVHFPIIDQYIMDLFRGERAL